MDAWDLLALSLSPKKNLHAIKVLVLGGVLGGEGVEVQKNVMGAGTFLNRLRWSSLSGHAGNCANRGSFLLIHGPHCLRWHRAMVSYGHTATMILHVTQSLLTCAPLQHAKSLVGPGRTSLKGRIRGRRST